MLKLLYQKQLKFENLYNGQYTINLGLKQRQGFGIQLYPNGFLYIGNWQYGMASGKGLIICPGNTYIMSHDFDMDCPKNIDCNFFTKEPSIQFKGILDIKGFLQKGVLYVWENISIENLQFVSGKLISGTFNCDNELQNFQFQTQHSSQKKSNQIFSKQIENINISLSESYIQIIIITNSVEKIYIIYNSPFWKTAFTNLKNKESSQSVYQKFVKFGEYMIKKEALENYINLNGIQYQSKKNKQKLKLPYMYYDRIAEKNQKFIYRHLSKQKLEKFKKETVNVAYFNKNFLKNHIPLRYFQEIEVNNLEDLWQQLHYIFDFHFLYKFRQDKNCQLFNQMILKFFNTHEEKNLIQIYTNKTQKDIQYQQQSYDKPYQKHIIYKSQMLNKINKQENQEFQQDIQKIQPKINKSICDTSVQILQKSNLIVDQKIDDNKKQQSVENFQNKQSTYTDMKDVYEKVQVVNLIKSENNYSDFLNLLQKRNIGHYVGTHDKNQQNQGYVFFQKQDKFQNERGFTLNNQIIENGYIQKQNELVCFQSKQNLQQGVKITKDIQTFLKSTLNEHDSNEPQIIGVFNIEQYQFQVQISGDVIPSKSFVKIFDKKSHKHFNGDIYWRKGAQRGIIYIDHKTQKYLNQIIILNDQNEPKIKVIQLHNLNSLLIIHKYNYLLNVFFKNYFVFVKYIRVFLKNYFQIFLCIDVEIDAYFFHILIPFQLFYFLDRHLFSIFNISRKQISQSLFQFIRYNFVNIVQKINL